MCASYLNAQNNVVVVICKAISCYL